MKREAAYNQTDGQATLSRVDKNKNISTGPVYCIGAANVDRKYYLLCDLVEKTSNPVVSSSSIGGVARNIAENLGRLGLSTYLITMSGQDPEWEMISDHTSPYVQLDHSISNKDLRTGTYTAVIDQTGEMTHGFADMEVYSDLTEAVLSQKAGDLQKAACIVADLNLPKESIRYLLKLAQIHKVPLAIVTVSRAKMTHLPRQLDGLEWLITNRDESLAYFDLAEEEISNQALVEKWLSLGVKHLVMTNGIKEVCYGSPGQYQTFKVEPSQKVVDVTGAGDAFAASLIFSWLSDFTLDQSMKMALANSKATIESNDTVRRDLTKQKLIDVLNK